MSLWLPHGTSAAGRVFAGDEGQSASVPALATYRGRLWCLWTDLGGRLWYARTGDDAQFGAPQPFPEAGLPVLANLNGVLHAIVVQPGGGGDDGGGGTMAHYVHDDDDAAVAWTALGRLDAAAGLVADATPAVVAFHNKLVLVFLRGGRLYYSIWSALGGAEGGTTPARQWTRAQLVTGGVDEATATTTTTTTTFRGIPALFVVEGVLHVLCGADTAERHIEGYRYDYIAQTWAQTDDVSEGRAASGVSAVSFGPRAYLGILGAGDDGGGSDPHAVSVAAFAGGAWAPHEAVGAGATAADPPQIAMLNGRVHCLFNDNTPTRDLRWYSRPVLGYALGAWMAGLPDDVPLSHLTIPGTHDSCARSNIPFVRTQYLSIRQQLALGIRFFDLRLRRHKDGRLYCYHGGVAIDYPRHLSLDAVMGEIWAFLWPGGDRDDAGGAGDAGDAGAARPTETVLVSINNDDHGPAQQADPAAFYGAVAAAIAATPPWPATGAHRWHTEPLTPRLGDVRGRAVLLRRYAGDPAVPPAARQGLDLSAWLDDNPDFTLVTPTQVRVRLQDKWKFADRIALHDLVASKAAMVQAMMGHAAAAAAAEAEATNTEDESAAADWYLNFCSAVGDPAEHGEIAEAKWIAVGAHSALIGKWVPGMNVLTSKHLQTTAAAAAAAAGRRTRLGVVCLDYPELPESNDVVARLIETNF